MITRNFHMRDGPEPRPPEPPRPEGWLARLRARLLGRRRAGAPEQGAPSPTRDR